MNYCYFVKLTLFILFSFVYFILKEKSILSLLAFFFISFIKIAVSLIFLLLLFFYYFLCIGSLTSDHGKGIVFNWLLLLLSLWELLFNVLLIIFILHL